MDLILELNEKKNLGDSIRKIIGSLVESLQIINENNGHSVKIDDIAKDIISNLSTKMLKSGEQDDPILFLTSLFSDLAVYDQNYHIVILGDGSAINIIKYPALRFSLDQDCICIFDQKVLIQQSTTKSSFFKAEYRFLIKNYPSILVIVADFNFKDSREFIQSKILRKELVMEGNKKYQLRGIVCYGPNEHYYPLTIHDDKIYHLEGGISFHIDVLEKIKTARLLFYSKIGYDSEN